MNIRIKGFFLGAVLLPTIVSATPDPLSASNSVFDDTRMPQPDYQVEGDIVLDNPEEQQLTAINTYNTAALDSAVAWPSGVVPFQLSGITPGSRHEKDILEAIETIERASLVDFVHKTSSHANYLTIYGHAFNAEKEKAKICSANIGFGSGGQRKAWIPSYCGVDSAIHELLHILGYRHEHQRTDRDYHYRDGARYSLSVNEEYAPCTMLSALTSSSLVARNLPYDHESIMHYNNISRTGCTSGKTGKVFSYRNLDTGENIDTLGGTRLSQGDLKSLRDGYGRERSQTPRFDGPSHKDMSILSFPLTWAQVHNYPDFFRINETSQEFIDINGNGRLDVGARKTHHVDASEYWKNWFALDFGTDAPALQNGYQYRFTIEACWDTSACSNESAPQTFSVLQYTRAPQPYIYDATPGDSKFIVRWRKEAQVQYVEVYRDNTYRGRFHGTYFTENLSSGTYQYELKACNVNGCSEEATLIHKHTVSGQTKPTEAPAIDSLALSEFNNETEFGFRKVNRATEYKYRVSGHGKSYSGSVSDAYGNYAGHLTQFYTRWLEEGYYQVSITPCNSSGCGPTATRSVKVDLDF